MTAWLITGGAGFVGSNFLRLALDREVHTIVVLDALTYAGNYSNIAQCVDGSRVKFCKGDVCDAALVGKLFAAHNFDCVVHFAAESHVDRSILRPHAFLRSNIEGSYVLLEAARHAWRSDATKRLFIQVSTDEVFGDLAPGEPAFDEETPYRPSSPYAASKASADHLARAWHRTYGVPVAITNCGNNFGPWQFPEKLIPLMIINAIEERELPVYGDGLQVRDWIHVLDHCRGIMAVIDRGHPGQTYLISGNNPRTNLDIVQRICSAVDTELGRASGSTARLVRHVTDRPGHDRRYELNSSHTRYCLGWEARENFDEAIPALVRWYIEKKKWIDSIRTGAYKEFYEMQYARR